MILRGVTQGSTLGPLMFLIYVNDMHQALKSKLFLYAHDLRLMNQHNDVKKLLKHLNKDSENVWIGSLTIN